MLDVVNVNRKLLKEKYTNFITSFRKDSSSLKGGYLVCDGRGFPITFAVHHAPPHVAKLAIFKPSPWKAMPVSQPSEVSFVNSGVHSSLLLRRPNNCVTLRFITICRGCKRWSSPPTWTP